MNRLLMNLESIIHGHHVPVPNSGVSGGNRKESLSQSMKAVIIPLSKEKPQGM